MAAEQVVMVQITPDGMLPIPEALRRELGLESAQTVQLTPQDNGLIVRPLSQQEIGDRIMMMLKKALAGLTWEDIKAERSSDDFSDGGLGPGRCVTDSRFGFSGCC